MRQQWARSLAFAWGLGAVACGGGSTPEGESAVAGIDDISADQWNRLVTEQIFFGHQSVGENVLEGVREILAARPGTGLQVSELPAGVEPAGPGLYHAAVGRNGEPATKLAAFREVVNGGFDGGIALLKYCYVDIGADTDAAALFAEYRSAVEELKGSRPGLTVVHVTLPLVTDIGTLRYVAARVRGLPTGREQNLIRHRYNELLRQTYAGREPVFDLAQLESTRADGRPLAVRFAGETVPVLAPEWTYDGGHLNEAGRRRIAEAFLVTLANARVSGRAQPSTASAP